MRARLLPLLLCLLPALANADERLGRLFLTPAERNSLDYLRQTSKPPEKVMTGGDAENADKQEPPPPPAVPAPVSVQGYVKRGDGKGTVWVNRQPVRETSRQGEIEVGTIDAAGNRIRLKAPGAGQPVAIKPGQTYDPASGKVVDHARELPKPEPVPTPPGPDKKDEREAPPAAADKPAQPAVAPAVAAEKKS